MFLYALHAVSKGVLYVHCVMHKCIMVKVGGKRKRHKVCEKHVNLWKTGDICKSRGKNYFFGIGGKCIEIAKIGGKFENF